MRHWLVLVPETGNLFFQLPETKKATQALQGEIVSGLNRKVKHQKLSGRGRLLERQFFKELNDYPKIGIFFN